MKKLVFIFSFIVALGFITQAQVKVDVKKKVNDQANMRANRQADRAINNAFDRVEDGIGSLFKRKKKHKKGNNNQAQQQQVQQQPAAAAAGAGTQATEEAKPEEPVLKWSKFDFVPGDEVIFEDGPSPDEENGEFPSRWDLVGGVCEIAEFGGTPVIMFPKRYSSIVPYLKNSKEDYLPEVFTIEFDCYFKKDESSTRYNLKLYDDKNQNSGKNKDVRIEQNQIVVGSSTGTTKGDNVKDDDNESFWRHISLAFTKGKLKVYLDNQRLINIPHYEANPTGITIAGRGNYDTQSYFIKNIRIAKGGVKYYDRVLSDGKIIVNGIRFDVNKATIKPQSNGAINKIFKLMQKQPDLRFSVEGHTDSDGDENSNLELSKARAKAVMDRLISMGISADRLKYNGWGESKPIADNGTPEGKANNRRVEFVKF